MAKNADFSHLKKLAVDQKKVIDYELMELEGDPAPKLLGVFAGETNSGYYNALIKRSSRNARRFRAKKLTTKELKQHRDEDRELFPQYVITGWENVKDAAGKVVKFNEANCLEFLTALPDWLFDDVRGFYANPESFVDELEVSDDDIHDLGNSLPTA